MKLGWRGVMIGGVFTGIVMYFGYLVERDGVPVLDLDPSSMRAALARNPATR